jgi:flagellar hook-associated protein 1 FlgK
MMDGHVLVQEETSRQLLYDEDINGFPQVYVSANAGRINVTDKLSGAFGGQIDAFETAATLQSDLDSWVNTFATAFNTQHQAGFDGSGNTNLDFFSFSAVSSAASLDLDANLKQDSSLLAVAGAVSATGFPDAGDGDNLDLLIALEDVTTYGTGGVFTAREQLTSLYAGLARDIQEAEYTYQMESLRLEDINELRASVSGVNLDEEAIKLMEYQASYEAAARVISVTNRLLGEIMEIV